MWKGYQRSDIKVICHEKLGQMTWIIGHILLGCVSNGHCQEYEDSLQIRAFYQLKYKLKKLFWNFSVYEVTQKIQPLKLYIEDVFYCDFTFAGNW